MSLVEQRVESGVCILTLNRPERRNAMSPQVQVELSALLLQAAADDDVRVAVITGAGGDFCVGGDFEVIGRMKSDSAYHARLVEVHAGAAEDILSFPKPTIAAVNGRAFGFGAEVAAFCDMVVMSRNARLADPHVRMGMPPAPGALLIWPQLTSRAIAAELMLTGREVGADEALRLGLCNRVAPEGAALPAALELAREIGDLPREGVMAVKAALRQSYRDLLSRAGSDSS
jgi:enoyl-CoA hydratase